MTDSNKSKKPNLAILLAVAIFIFFAPTVVSADPRPKVFLGAQYVAPWRTVGRVPGMGASVLALWPLSKRASLQIQYIHPLQRDTGGPLVRIAADVCVWRCR